MRRATVLLNRVSLGSCCFAGDGGTNLCFKSAGMNHVRNKAIELSMSRWKVLSVKAFSELRFATMSIAG